MRVVRVAIVSAAFVSVALLAPSARAGDPAAARDQLKLGWQLSQDGKCDEAIPHLAESLRLDVKAITLINLANCEEKVGRLADALGHWVDARARAQVEGNSAIELEAEKRQTALEPRLAHLTITLAAGAPAGTEISRDGNALGKVSLGVRTSVSPGTHTIVVRAPGRRETKIDVALAEAEDQSIEARPGEPDESAPTSPSAPEDASSGGSTSPLVYVGFGVGAAGLALGTITGLMAISKGNVARNTCPNLECPSQSDVDSVESGRTLGTIATVSLIAGAAFTAIGVYGVVAGGKRSDAAKAAVYVGPTGAGVHGSF